jgi:hypothetical protein
MRSDVGHPGPGSRSPWRFRSTSPRLAGAAFVALAVLFLLPSSGFAQATLAGVVRDPSGAVLPGVTVEASSPALIEKVRVAVTDTAGQYQIVDLRPGTYAVSYSLQGFATSRREAVQVTGAGVITVDVELRVGNVTETVSVTGETPTVDVQSTLRQSVLDNRLVNDLPVSRGYGDVMLAIPTLQGGPLNASVNALSVLPNFFTTHGGRGNEGNIQVDGMTAAAAFNGGGVSGFGYDIANAAEMQITLSGALGEAETGGPTLNLVSPSGGNTFRGTAFFSSAGEWSQGSNLDEELEGFGITEQAALIKSWDISATLGGPIVRDRLWFFVNGRDYGNHTDIPGLYANGNVGNPNSWTYVQNTALKARAATSKTIVSGRLTAQVTPRNKVGFYHDYQWDCDQGSQSLDEGCRKPTNEWVLGSSFFGPAWAPEAISNYWDGREKITQFTWTSPLTNKLLLDAGYSSFVSHWGWMKQPGAPLNLTGAFDVAPCPPAPAFCHGVLFFRAPGTLVDMQLNDQQTQQWRASMSYVTGSHNMKFGYRGAAYLQEHELQSNDTQMWYLLAGGFPLNFTMSIRPWEFSNRTNGHGFYAQDQWTFGRATLQGAVRYDYAYSYFPGTHNGAPVSTPLNPQPITFPRSDGVTGYHDITPRMGGAYDLFGDGRTAVKVHLGKYLQAANNDATYIISNPASPNNFQTVATRAWFDADGDKVVDCDRLNPAANGECLLADLGNFANPNTLTVVNPDVLHGWGVRPYDWQFGASVQQEIAPRTSVEVGYHRRWFGNFFVTDNILLSPSDFGTLTVTAPQQERLPEGGGFTEQFYTLQPGASSAFQNRFTFASDYGDWTQYWHGVDVTVNTRIGERFVLQAGTSTGRGVLDNCEVQDQVPEMSNTALTSTANRTTTPWQPIAACNVAEKVLTQLRGNASYTIPRIDVLLSGIFRSQPNAVIGGGNNLGSNGQALAANYTLPGNTQTVNLLQPGQHYADRINQLDLRLTKILRFGGTRTSVGIDVLNLFNSNTGTAYNDDFSDNTISTYLRPTAILNPRFVRFNITVDY